MSSSLVLTWCKGRSLLYGLFYKSLIHSSLSFPPCELIISHRVSMSLSAIALVIMFQHTNGGATLNSDYCILSLLHFYSSYESLASCTYKYPSNVSNQLPLEISVIGIHIYLHVLFKSNSPIPSILMVVFVIPVC